ncbi:MAG: DUF2933 domain-containing protein [Mycobacteriales bacterium]
MSKDKYPQYGLVAVAVMGLAVWAGLPVATLLFLLVCPLMMFLMMRGMQGGHPRGADHSTNDERRGSDSAIARPVVANGSRSADSSHERIDHP